MALIAPEAKTYDKPLHRSDLGPPLTLRNAHAILPTLTLCYKAIHLQLHAHSPEKRTPSAESSSIVLERLC